jgi:hypothetical protein
MPGGRAVMAWRTVRVGSREYGVVGGPFPASTLRTFARWDGCR